MSSDMNRTLERLQARIETVELANVRLQITCLKVKWFSLITVVFVGSLVLLGARAMPSMNTDEVGEKQKVVKAERFVLTDNAGEMKSAWGTKEGNPYFVLYNGKQKQRVLISAADKAAALKLYSQQGKHRLNHRARFSCTAS